MLRIVLLCLVSFCFQICSYAQFAPLPPFSISIEKVVTTQPLPGYHSFAFAQHNGKWLIMGGRTNGLHGLNPNDSFDQTYANNNAVVIDTATWQIYYSSFSNLPYAVADPLRSTNMQYVQDGDYLYMVGGYGRDSILNLFVTFPVLSSIRVDSLINAVIANTNINPFIRQFTDSSLQVCGGELQKMGNDFYLLFGHNFNGRYDQQVGSSFFTQEYINQVRKFNIVNDTISVLANNFSFRTDTNNFHRRDLTSGPIITPSGQERIMAYGGVFKKNKDLPFLEPIEIETNKDSVYTYQQVMSHYTCANLPIFDSVNLNMYSTFLGGISLYDYDPNTNTVIQDTLVPFISDITTFTKRSNGMMEECVLPLQLPYLLGSNAKFILGENVPQYGNEVIKLKAINNRIMAGYLFGGIRSDAPNYSTTTVANDTIYRIYINTTPFNSVPSQNLIKNLKIYPNPANELVNVSLFIENKTNMRFQLIDNSGKIVKEIFKGEISGEQHLNINTRDISPGIYYIKLISDKGSQTFPVSVTH